MRGSSQVKPAYDNGNCGCLQTHNALPPSYPAQAGYAVRCGFSVESQVPWDTGSSAFADDDNCVCRIDQPATAGTGRAVTDLIFSIAKREVTFFSGTAPISFL